MTPSRPARVLLWLLVIFLGITFGAGLYEHRIVVDGHWIATAPDGSRHWDAGAAARDDTGRRFWAFVTTGPLTLITLANLFFAWRSTGRLRRWWLIASVAALADRIFTFGYFIPTMIGLLGAPDSAESVAAATRWANLNYLRHAIVLAAWMASLRTFALVYEKRGGGA